LHARQLKAQPLVACVEFALRARWVPSRRKVCARCGNRADEHIRGLLFRQRRHAQPGRDAVADADGEAPPRLRACSAGVPYISVLTHLTGGVPPASHARHINIGDRKRR
jgi:hypothetical protein